jgi:hypothetical protein
VWWRDAQAFRPIAQAHRLIAPNANSHSLKSGVYQDHPSDLTGICRGKISDYRAAERVADEHEWTRLAQLG